VRRPDRLLAAFFTAAGALHFVRPRTYERIVPDYLPAHRDLVLASGAAELAGAAGLLFAPTRRLAGIWLALTLVAVFPANVHMALHPDRHPSIGAAVLCARLPLQPLLIWWILRATRPPRGIHTNPTET
jgi:uncharacterized membrane protein